MTTVLVASTGCGADYEDTRAEATDEARTQALAVQDALTDLASAPDAPTGEALVTAVGEAVPDVAKWRTTFGLSPAGADGALLDIAFDGFAENNGGGTYHQFLARLCVEYRVIPGAEPPVTVEDTRCPAALLEPTGPTQKADSTVSLDD